MSCIYYNKAGLAAAPLHAELTLALFPGQFIINRMDEKNRPGIDCIRFCAHAPRKIGN